MTDPTTGNDDLLEAALRGMPRPTPDAARRDAHIATALDALEATTLATVVPLAARRRGRFVMGALGSVAAAGLFVVGLGIGRVSAPDAPAANAPVRNAALTTLATPVDSNPLVAECPRLGFGSPSRVITGFGSYVLVRSGDSTSGRLIVIDTQTCKITTQIGLSDVGG